MKTLALTLLMALLSVFALYALPDSTVNIELDSLMENYKAANRSVIQRMDTITAKVDAMYAQIESESEKNWLGVDIDKANVWIAFFALVFGIFGYKETRRTAKNVLRASFNVQKGQFDDLIRHLYRNLVCTLAFTQKTVENRNLEQLDGFKPFKNDSGSKKQKKNQGVSGKTKGELQKQKNKYFPAHRQAERQNKETSRPELTETKPQKYQYPSEEHLQKLKVLPEDVLHLECYNHDYTIYKKMHNLKLLLRNYDMEIDTAMTYLKDGTQDNAVIMGKLDALTFKPLFLISQIVGVVKSLDEKEAKKLKGKNIDEYQNAASIMTLSHVGNLIDNKDLFKINEYLDLNLLLQLEKTEKAKTEKNEVKEPYNGLARAYNRFFKEVINANEKKVKPDEEHTDKTAEDKVPVKDYVTHSERFKDKKPNDYKTTIEGICGKDNNSEATKRLEEFKNSIIPAKENNIIEGNFSFKEHFLTMLSIDVTIELSKIHMIDIN